MLSFNVQCLLQNNQDQFQLSAAGKVTNQGITAIFGPSGCGKTTLFETFAGLNQQATGQITLSEQTWLDSQKKIFTPAYQRGVGYVFQDARLFPHLTVLDNLKFAIRRRLNGYQQYLSLNDAISLLSLDKLINRYPYELSGGQQQRVAIARGLLAACQLILMDEPSTALDRASRREIWSSLHHLAQQIAIPWLVISHDIHEVNQLADQVILMEEGNITANIDIFQLSHYLPQQRLDLHHMVSVVEGNLTEHDQQHHLSFFDLDGFRVCLHQLPYKPGNRIRLEIPAKDVSLALQPNHNTSALNSIPCTISKITNVADGLCLIELTIKQQRILSLITSKSCQQLQLESGKAIYASIKSVALLSRAIAT
ncbi:molybdenum ABC transporter ATP-binding protein [Spartinivicinus poritis]|uniref:Molybdenum ABC transporter ATP-binding protein n=1 Tax=Spartinivicinus poritis TaxID=2994640 RepID=A0ABT5UAD0_9GAMM|nr:molybdenum ABC transporter ATP-binding protein [Spartinivicinus sp. A2-2]MDE1463125.1 molybdenum ABC transporter ATP-binding protein [Spartinivicinus sp. A2-2]